MSNSKLCDKCKVPLKLIIQETEKPDWICYVKNCTERNVYDTKYCHSHKTSGHWSYDDDDRTIAQYYYSCPKCGDYSY